MRLLHVSGVVSIEAILAALDFPVLLDGVFFMPRLDGLFFRSESLKHLLRRTPIPGEHGLPVNQDRVGVRNRT